MSLVVLGKYRIERAIGGGVSGSVYRARVVDTEAAVAVKEVRRDLGWVPVIGSACRLALQAAQNVEHAKLGRLLAIAEEDDRTLIVSDWVDGEGLAEVTQWSDGRLPDSEGGFPLFVQLLDGLEAAHRGGLVHGDIKPDNILIPRGGGTLRASLVDFGVGAILADTGVGRMGEGLVANLTYRAPEQLRDPTALSPSVDIYAMGAVLYQVLTGQPPFAYDIVGRLIEAHMRDRPQPVRELNPEVPEELARVAERALDKDPGARFASAGEMRDLIKPFAPVPKKKKRRPLPPDALRKAQQRAARRSPDAHSAATKVDTAPQLNGAVAAAVGGALATAAAASTAPPTPFTGEGEGADGPTKEMSAAQFLSAHGDDVTARAMESTAGPNDATAPVVVPPAVIATPPVPAPSAVVAAPAAPAPRPKSSQSAPTLPSTPAAPAAPAAPPAPVTPAAAPPVPETPPTPAPAVEDKSTAPEGLIAVSPLDVEPVAPPPMEQSRPTPPPRQAPRRATAKASGGGNAKLWIGLAVVVVLLAAAAGGYLLFFDKDGAAASKSGDETAAQVADEESSAEASAEGAADEKAVPAAATHAADETAGKKPVAPPDDGGLEPPEEKKETPEVKPAGEDPEEQAPEVAADPAAEEGGEEEAPEDSGEEPTHAEPAAEETTAEGPLGAGGFPKAEETDVSRRDARKAKSLNGKGYKLYKQGRNGDALTSYREALSLDPNVAQYWYNTACLFALRGDVDSAVAHLKGWAARMEPSDGPRLFDKLGQDTDFDAIRRHPRFRAFARRFQ